MNKRQNIHAARSFYIKMGETHNRECKYAKVIMFSLLVDFMEKSNTKIDKKGHVGEFGFGKSCQRSVGKNMKLEIKI